MTRSVASIVAGVVTWFVIATLGNFVLRAAVPRYAAVEVAMTFTLGMLFERLALGIVSSLGAGFVTAWISGTLRRDVALLTVLLLVLFVPVHYSLWQRFPVWYHMAFLLSLALVPALGASLHAGATGARRRPSA